MPKRFIATELWSEDWFLEIPSEYKLFWYYMLSKCDHAGVFKPNMRTFNLLNEVNLSPNSVLKYFNNGKERIRVVSDSVWLIEDFFVFQYGPHFNEKNRVHESIENEWLKNKIKKETIRGLLGPKDEDKDRAKDKEKDKEKYKEKYNNYNKAKFSKNFAESIWIDNVEHKPIKNGEGWVYPTMVAIEVTDENEAVFADGDTQPLGTRQIALKSQNCLDINMIKKGLIQ